MLFIGAEGGLGVRTQGATAGRAPAGLEFESVSGAGEGSTLIGGPHLSAGVREEGGGAEWAGKGGRRVARARGRPGRHGLRGGRRENRPAGGLGRKEFFHFSFLQKIQTNSIKFKFKEFEFKLNNKQ